MTYSMVIKRANGDPTYKNGIPTWNDVTDILRKGLDQWTTNVHIYKYSSNDRLLGEKCVTMGNLWDVANSPKDNIVLI